MKLLSSSKGEIAQLKVQIRAAEKNLISSIPQTEVQYDIILDDNINKKIYRAQIKFCDRKHGNNLQLNLCDTDGKRNHYTSDDIDILLVFLSKVDKILIYNSKKFHKKTSIQINLNDKKSPHYFEKYIW